MREAKSIDLFLLVLLGLIWGSSFFNIKIATYSYEPFTLALVRVIFASIPLFILCKLKRIEIKAFSNNWKSYALIGLSNITIPFVLIAVGTGKINSYLAAMLMSTTPLSGSILAHFFTKDDKFNIIKLISVIIGLIGTLFIIDFKNFFILTEGSYISFVAKIAVIIAALGYMISNIIAYNKLKNVNTITITTFATLFGAIVSIPFMLYFELTEPSSINFSSFISLIYLGLFPTAIAFQFRYYITKKSGPTFLSYVAYLIPVFAIFWGYLILGEKVALSSILGILLVLLGVYVGQKKLMYKGAN